MFRGFANGNDSNLLTSFRMGHRDYLVLQQSKGEEPPLAISLALVLGRQGHAAENLSRVGEIDAVLAEVGAPLRFVPGENMDYSYIM